MHEMLIAILMIIGGGRLDLPPAEVQQRFAQECVDGKWGESCPALRTELEVELYGELRTLALSRESIPREVLLAAARAKFPPLAEIGLRRLESIQSPAERDGVAAAVDHPSPAIRTRARRLLEAHGDVWAKSLGRWWAESNADGWDVLLPDQVPMAAQLGLVSVDKLRYRFFASTPGRAVFTTALAPEAALAMVAPGRKTHAGTEVLATPKQMDAFNASLKEIETQMREAMAKGDYKKMEEISRAMAKASQGLSGNDTLGIQLEKEFAADPSARYVRLDNGKGRPIQAAVGRDAALGETVMVVRY